MNSLPKIYRKTSFLEFGRVSEGEQKKNRRKRKKELQYLLHLLYTFVTINKSYVSVVQAASLFVSMSKRES